MSVVFLVFARNEPLADNKSLDYVGCIEKFSGETFTTEVRYRKIEIPEGEGYLFVLYDPIHDSDRLHTIFYDAPKNIDTPEAAEYALWIQNCLIEVFTQFQVHDAQDINFYFMSRTNTDNNLAIVYDTPFDKTGFMDNVAKDLRTRIGLVKG